MKTADSTFFSLETTIRNSDTGATDRFVYKHFRTFESAKAYIEWTAEVDGLTFEIEELTQRHGQKYADIYSVKWFKDGRSILPWDSESGLLATYINTCKFS